MKRPLVACLLAVSLLPLAAVGAPAAELPTVGVFSTSYDGGTAAQRAAVDRAVASWARVLYTKPYLYSSPSTTPVTVRVRFSASVRDPRGSWRPAAYLPARSSDRTALVPIALHNVRTGTDHNGPAPEVLADLPADPAAYSTSGTPAAGQQDLETVALRGLAQGLGFLGSMTVRSRNGVLVGSWGTGAERLPLLFDTKVLRLAPTYGTLLGLGQDQPRTAVALTTGSVAFGGQLSSKVVCGPVVLHTPSTWVPGLSYQYLAPSAQLRGTPDELLVAGLPPQRVIHEIGPLTHALLADLGWATAPVPAVTACGPAQVSYAEGVHVQGLADSSDVELWARGRTETAFTLRTRADSSYYETYSFFLTADDDYAYFVRAHGVQSRTRLVLVRPDMRTDDRAAPATPTVASLPRGSEVTFRGTGQPGTPVVLHVRLQSTRGPGYPITRTVLPGLDGQWQYRTRLTQHHQLYATSTTNGTRSRQTLLYLAT